MYSLTGEGKSTVFSKVQEEAHQENIHNAGQATFKLGNQTVPDYKSNWDQPRQWRGEWKTEADPL